MTLRRDHVASLLIIAFGVAVYVLGRDLPFGTPASPGPGMLPDLVAGVMIALALVLLLQSGSSPPLAELNWDDVGHAAVVTIAATAATSLYTLLGFPITIALLLITLMVGVERRPLLPGLTIALGVTAATYLLLGSLLKTPLPRGIFEF